MTPFLRTRWRCPSLQRATLVVPLLVAPWLVAMDTALAQAAPPTTMPDAVEIDWDTYALLSGVDEAPPLPEGPHAAFRSVTLTPRVDGDPPGTLIRAVWNLRADRPGFVSGILAGPDVEIERARIDGVPAPVVRTPTGGLLVAFVTKDAKLELDAFVPAAISAQGGELKLALLPAVRGVIEVDHPTLRLQPSDASQSTMVRTDAKLWSGVADLNLRLLQPTAPEKAEGPLAVASAGLGVTIGEAELKARARVVWTLRRGVVERLAVRVSGLGDDLEVEGRDIAKWTRNGDVVELELGAPNSTRVEVALRWSLPLTESTEATFAIPRIEPQDAFRTETSLQLARDGEIEAVPVVDDWNAIPADELPPWGRGLVEGTPTAAYQRGHAGGDVGSLSLLRFVPVPGPAAVIDVAAYTIATTDEGRIIARAKYQIRNERAAFLRVTPPEGVSIIGARIAGETAIAGRDTKTGTWLIPLKRSLETVEGLLSFPVEITLLGDSDAWRRRERRSIALPTVDAPIAVSRVTLHLPPEFRSKLEPGDASVVDEFTEGQGITYGLGLDDEQTAQADQLLQQAVEDFRSNDFDAAQAKLAQLETIGAVNENVERLQANVDLVTGKGDKAGKGGGGDEALARRVKDQAKARAAEELGLQRELEQQAETLYRAGDYEEAEATFEQAIDLGEKLEHLEQDESVEISARNESLQQSLGKVKAEKKRKAKPAVAQSRTPSIGFRTRAANRRSPAKDEDADSDEMNFKEMEPVDASGAVSGTTVYEFADDSLDATDHKTLDGYAHRGPEPEKSPPEPDTPAQAPPPREGERWNGQPPTSGRWDRNVEAPKNIPLGESTERDFTAVVESSATASTDSAGIALAGTTGAERDYEVEGMNVNAPSQARRRARRSGAFFSGRGGGGGGASGRVKHKRSNDGGGRRSKQGAREAQRTEPSGSADGDAFARARESAGAGGFGLGPASTPPPPGASPEPEPDPAKPMPASPDEATWSPTDAPAVSDGRVESRKKLDEGSEFDRLPAPVATASALSVVIPAIGEMVLYQTLLIEAGQAQTIPIDARRRLRRR